MKKKKDTGGLNDKEEIVMSHLVEAWNAYLELSKQHPDDIEDFRRAIHMCEYLLMIRQVRENHPKYYINEE